MWKRFFSWLKKLKCKCTTFCCKSSCQVNIDDEQKKN